MERVSKKAKTTPAASLQLKVVTLRRDYQFVDTAFEVQVFLQSQDGQIATGLGDLPVAVSLAYEAGADAPPQDMLALDSPPLVVNGRSALAVRLTDTSMNVGNRKVCLVVEATENGHSGGANGSGIAPSNVAAAKSAPIRVIRHKLELDIPANSWAGQWYKDEGGRDKAISLPVKLVDANGSLVIGREVPLTARLLYESGTVVPDQANVLKVHDSSSVGINQATGKGELKVRLEQVSRNHNHQDFQVELLPDTVASPLDLDVGTTTSNSVTVLSKRNRGTTAGAGSSSHASSSAPAGGGRRNQRTASHRPQQLSQGYATDPRTAAEAVAAAQAAVVEAVPLVELPHPQGGGGVYGSMENVLGWIQNALTVMETQGAVLQNALTVVEAAQAQHQALRSTLENAYTARIQEDLQLLVADFNSSSVSTDNGNSGPAEPSPPPPLALDLGSTPAPAPQPPSNDSASDNLLALARPSPMIRQTSSSYFSARGCVSADVEAALHSAPYAPMGTGGAGDSAAETSIAYIVAKLFVTSSANAIQEKIGFPAFTAEKQLVGFFREVEPDDGGAMTGDHDVKMEFLPLTAARAAGRLNEENVAAGALSLDRELSRQSKSVFKLDGFNGTLEDMKAAALFYFTEKAGHGATRGGGNSVGMGRSTSEMDPADLELFRQTSDTDPIWTFEL